MRKDILCDIALFQEVRLADVFLTTAHVDTCVPIRSIVGLMFEVRLGRMVDYAVFASLPRR